MKQKEESIQYIIKKAREEKRSVLLEPEGLELLKAMDIPVPDFLFVEDTSDIHQHKNKIPKSERLVVKVVSPTILHKSDVGGVQIIKNDMDILIRTLEEMERRLKNKQLRGFLIAECVPYEGTLGSELLIGLRNTVDFGPVLTFGPGGIYTEFLAEHFRDGENVSILTPELSDKRNIEEAIEDVAVSQLVTNRFRGRDPSISAHSIAETIEKILLLAKTFIPSEISEFEVNPFVVHNNKLIALDVLIKLSEGEEQQKQEERPLHKIKNLLEPKSAAMIGVSEKMNVGHIILNNFIKNGFPKDKLYIVKQGLKELEGCKSFETIQDLPEKVDLFVICIPALKIPEVITELTEKQKAESIIVIPGGMEEKEGTEAMIEKMHKAISKARRSSWKGPVINGGNCLGIISRPGKYDTMFIPDYKKAQVPAHVSSVAFISQSGAFAVSRLNKLIGINPKYSITIGNQTDLTMGDYISYLKDDPEISLFSLYIEGFKPNDGLRFLKAAREVMKKGKKVLLYASGKTKEGAMAMASHTASIAGNYTVTKELCKRTGVLLAESLADFEDLTRVFTFLEGKPLQGKRLGIVSNAGCECVAASDHVGQLKLASFTEKTNRRLENIFKESKIDTIVDVHNPVDLTPMADDAAYEATIQTVLDDDHVDIGVIACIPLAPSLNALPKGEGHREDYLKESSIVQRIIRLHMDSKKPWVAVIDAGPLFDPMAQLFEEKGIPVFRTIDRALKIINLYIK